MDIAPSNEDPKTIEDLKGRIKSWYAYNYKGFRDGFDAAVAGLKPPACFRDDPVYMDWQHATEDTLCDFFEEWYNWTPDVETGLQYIQRFAWLYYENDAGLAFVTGGPGWVITKNFVEIQGKWMDSEASKPLIERWIKELGSKMDEYVVPPGGYQNFNQFFIRTLKEPRAVTEKDNPELVVSPADAVINMIDDNLSMDSKLPVKTQRLDIPTLLDGSPLAEEFIGGTALSCILMPDVYHHYHSPVTGMVVESNQDVVGDEAYALDHPEEVVKGGYFGIPDFPELLDNGNVGYGSDYAIFEHFRRGYLIIKTDDYGYVAMIPVGLNTIGSVVFEEDFKRIRPADPHQPIKKGQHVGYFQYGGSLNILLFQRGVYSSVRVPQGQGIGTMSKPTGTKAQYVF